jgi:hypothetical protein
MSQDSEFKLPAQTESVISGMNSILAELPNCKLPETSFLSEGIALLFKPQIL